jgi:hypothetical protein
MDDCFSTSSRLMFKDSVQVAANRKRPNSSTALMKPLGRLLGYIRVISIVSALVRDLVTVRQSSRSTEGGVGWGDKNAYALSKRFSGS